MPRREQPLDPDAGPLELFAVELRQLRYQAGNPPYRQLARKAFRSAAALSAAAGGKSFPSLEVTLAYVRACGGDEKEWKVRWLALNAQLTSARAREAGAAAPGAHRPAVQPLTGGDPTMVGPFRLSGRLGAGAMGQVYLGHTPGLRPVAVKVIRPELADEPLFRRRFRREIEAARTVHGLYIAPLVAADPDADQPWLATAFIPGPTLSHAVAEHGALPTDSVLQTGAGIAEALLAIHAAGVVHRDLKPSNVLLADDGPRVIDFGIAHAAGTTQLTHAGTRVGTPAYSPPELVLGNQVSPAVDIFSLGAVLVYAATGRTPFGEGSPDAVLYRLVHEQANLDGVPDQVRAIVADCLAKDPELRPRPDEVLRRCQRSSPAPHPSMPWLPEPITTEIDRYAEAVSTEPSSPLRRLRSRVTVLVAVVAVVAVAAVLGFVVGSRQDQATGSLRLRQDTVPPAVNLSEQKSIDWTHWGYLESDARRPEPLVRHPVSQDCRYNPHCVNRKSGAHQISDYTTIGNAAPFRQRDQLAPVAFSWSDGEPTLAAHDVRTSEHMGSRGNGFRLHVTAGRTPRTFTLYVSVYQGKARYAASLSDGSAEAVVDSSLNSYGVYDENRSSTYTLTYQAANDRESLIVELTLEDDNGGGNVALFAATLR